MCSMKTKHNNFDKFRQNKTYFRMLLISGDLNLFLNLFSNTVITDSDFNCDRKVESSNLTNDRFYFDFENR